MMRALPPAVLVFLLIGISEYSLCSCVPASHDFAADCQLAFVISNNQHLSDAFGDQLDHARFAGFIPCGTADGPDCEELRTWIEHFVFPETEGSSSGREEIVYYFRYVFPDHHCAALRPSDPVLVCDHNLPSPNDELQMDGKLNWDRGYVSSCEGGILRWSRWSRVIGPLRAHGCSR